jgi:hypothetical protein
MPTMGSARDVPEIRARMAAWTRDPGADGAANWFTFWLGPHPEQATESRVFDRADDVSAIISGTLAAQLPIAELFYVSDDMTELAGHAATTLTDYRLHPEDLPAQVGVMVYAHPPATGTATDSHDGLTVVSWGPGRGGLWVHTWATLSEEWASGRHGSAGCWPGCPMRRYSPARSEAPNTRCWTRNATHQRRSRPPTRSPPGCCRTFGVRPSRPRSPRPTATTGVD